MGAAHVGGRPSALRQTAPRPPRHVQAVRKALAAGMFINAARLTEELKVNLAGKAPWTFVGGASEGPAVGLCSPPPSQRVSTTTACLVQFSSLPKAA